MKNKSRIFFVLAVIYMGGIFGIVEHTQKKDNPCLPNHALLLKKTHTISCDANGVMTINKNAIKLPK